MKKQKITVTHDYWEYVGINDNGVIVNIIAKNNGKLHFMSEDEYDDVWLILRDASDGARMPSGMKVEITEEMT